VKATESSVPSVGSNFGTLTVVEKSVWSLGIAAEWVLTAAEAGDATAISTAAMAALGVRARTFGTPRSPAGFLPSRRSGCGFLGELRASPAAPC
jgi:hypothetical protein